MRDMRPLLVCLLLLTACSSGSGEARPAPTEVDLAPASPTTSATAAAPSASPSLVVETGAPGEFSSFDTPSGNIACGVSERGAECEVRDYTWKLPPRPADCVDADWIGGLSVGKDGQPASVGSCQTDTVFGSGKVLAYGHALRVGGVQCASYRTGVECVVVGSRHGFFVSKATYRVS